MNEKFNRLAELLIEMDVLEDMAVITEKQAVIKIRAAWVSMKFIKDVIDVIEKAGIENAEVWFKENGFEVVVDAVEEESRDTAR